MSYKTESILIYNFANQLLSSQPTAKFISDSFKNNLSLILQYALVPVVSVIRNSFSKYYFDELLNSFNYNCEWYTLTIEENIQVIAFLQLFIDFYGNLISTILNYNKVYELKEIWIIPIIEELQCAITNLKYVIDKLNEYIILTSSQGRIIKYEESEALNERLKAFQLCITSWDFIIDVNPPQQTVTVSGFSCAESPCNLEPEPCLPCLPPVEPPPPTPTPTPPVEPPPPPPTPPCPPPSPSPCYYIPPIDPRNLYQIYNKNTSPCMYQNPQPVIKPLYKKKYNHTSFTAWYYRPLSLVKDIPTHSNKKEVILTIYHLENELPLSSSRKIGIVEGWKKNYLMLLVQETLVGFLININQRENFSLKNFIVVGESEIMIDKKRKSFLVLDVLRQQLD